MTVINDDRTFIFLHLMKVAGTSFNTVLSQQFHPQRIYSAYAVTPEDFVATYQSLSEEDKNNIDLIRGHLSFGFHSWVPKPSVYITFVRDPVERVISYYCYIKRSVGHPYHRYLNEHNISLYSFVTELWCPQDEISNVQTRLISGDTNDLSRSEALLHKAKLNIDTHFPIVGLTEQFNQSLFLMKAAFGWRYRDCLHPRLNVTKRRMRKTDIDKKTLDAIMKHNELDIKLYEFCVARFDDVIRKQADSFKNIVNGFALINAAASPVMKMKIQHTWHRKKREKWNAGLDWNSSEL